MSGFLDRLARRATGAEAHWQTRPRSRFEPSPTAGVAGGPGRGLFGEVGGAGGDGGLARGAGWSSGGADGSGALGWSPGGADLRGRERGAVGELDRRRDPAEDELSDGVRRRRGSRAGATRDADDDVATGTARTSGAAQGRGGTAGRRGGTAGGRHEPTNAAGAAQALGGRGAARAGAPQGGRARGAGRGATDGDDVDRPGLGDDTSTGPVDRTAPPGAMRQGRPRRGGRGDLSDALGVIPPGRAARATSDGSEADGGDAAAGASGLGHDASGSGRAQRAPVGTTPSASRDPVEPHRRGRAAESHPTAASRRTRPATGPRDGVALTAGGTASGAVGARTSASLDAVLDTRTLLGEHVVPALRAQGLLGASERLDLRLGSDTAPGTRRTAVVADPNGRTTDARAAGPDSPPEVHVHIGSVHVVRPAPPTPPAPPAASAADPSSDRLAAFLAERRSR